jgi:hypothetical protein
VSLSLYAKDPDGLEFEILDGARRCLGSDNRARSRG